MKNSSFARMITSARVLLGLVVCSALNQSVAFAASPLLYDPQSLQQALTQASPPVILDVRTMDAYAVGHIPTACWIDANLWQLAFTELQQPRDASVKKLLTRHSTFVGQVKITG